jgi:hypothetical protein
MIRAERDENDYQKYASDMSKVTRRFPPDSLPLFGTSRVTLAPSVCELKPALSTAEH